MSTSADTTRPILVIEATGNVGHYVVNGLAEAGTEVRAVARNPAHLTDHWGSAITAVAFDFADPSTWAAAFDGVATTSPCARHTSATSAETWNLRCVPWKRPESVTSCCYPSWARPTCPGCRTPKGVAQGELDELDVHPTIVLHGEPLNNARTRHHPPTPDHRSGRQRQDLVRGGNRRGRGHLRRTVRPEQTPQHVMDPNR